MIVNNEFQNLSGQDYSNDEGADQSCVSQSDSELERLEQKYNIHKTRMFNNKTQSTASASNLMYNNTSFGHPQPKFETDRISRATDYRKNIKERGSPVLDNCIQSIEGKSNEFQSKLNEIVKMKQSILAQNSVINDFKKNIGLYQQDNKNLLAKLQNISSINQELNYRIQEVTEKLDISETKRQDAFKSIKSLQLEKSDIELKLGYFKEKEKVFEESCCKFKLLENEYESMKENITKKFKEKENFLISKCEDLEKRVEMLKNENEAISSKTKIEGLKQRIQTQEKKRSKKNPRSQRQF